MNGPVTLRWEDAYRHDASALRVHGRRNTSTHEFRRYVQSAVRERLRRASAREQLREYLSGTEEHGILDR